MRLAGPIFVQKIRTVIKCAISAWIDHRAASKGAALAFYTLFSMAPILLLVIAIAGFFFTAPMPSKEQFWCNYGDWLAGKGQKRFS